MSRKFWLKQKNGFLIYKKKTCNSFSIFTLEKDINKLYEP